MSDPQCAADVLMIRPASFCANPQTAASNAFQSRLTMVPDAQKHALAEFNGLVQVLRSADVGVHVFDEASAHQTPDALFPNNWVSFHADGAIALYPMLAPNRRAERRSDILNTLTDSLGFRAKRLVDLTHHENAAHYLEGTGSLVLDRQHRIAYACLSPRTHINPLREYAALLGYEVVAFEAFDAKGAPIYHTNVLLSIGERYAAICIDAVRADQRSLVIDKLRSAGQDIVELSHAQMNAFAGNILQLATKSGGRIVALSDRALTALSPEQRERLQTLAGPLVTAPIPTIETLGGGSVRCMLAEIHLPRSA